MVTLAIERSERGWGPCRLCPPVAIVAAALAVAGAGCAELPELGECGNGVVEPRLGEACDDGGESATCSDSCELWCQASAVDDYVEVGVAGDGPVFCPEGHGCGDDLICRAPEGRFYRLGDPIAFDADQVHVGDVNDDAIPDLIGLSATTIRVRYGDTVEPFGAESSLAAPIITGRAYAGHLSDDDTSDLLVPTLGGVVKYLAEDGVLKHRVERTFDETDVDDPVAPLSIVTANGFELLLGAAVIDVDPGPGTNWIVFVVSVDGPDGLEPVAACALPSGPGVAYAPVRRHPFARLATATGDRFVILADRIGTADDVICRWEPLQIEMSTTQIADVATVHGLGRDLIDDGVMFANVDGDPCHELVWSVVDGAGFDFEYLDDDAAGGCSFGPIRSITQFDRGRLLAAGDLDGQGRDELITTDGIIQYLGGAWTRILPATIEPTATWGTAVTADLDGDGRPDVAAAPAIGEDFVVARTAGVAVNGQIMFTPSTVQTAGEVADHGIVVGDYDGDGTDDLAIAERRDDQIDALTVAYGSRDGVLDVVEISDFENAELVLIRMGPVLYVDGQANPLGIDAVDDLAVALITPTSLDVAILFGTAQRSLTAPLWVEGGMGPGDARVTGTVAHDFVGDDGIADVFLLGETHETPISQGMTPHSWLWRGAADATFAIDEPAVPTALIPEDGFFPSSLVVVENASREIHVASADSRGAITFDTTTGTCDGMPALALPGIANMSPILRATDLDGIAGHEMIASFRNRDRGAAFVVAAMPGSCSAPADAVSVATLVGFPEATCADAAPIDLDTSPPVDLVALCTTEGDVGIVVPLANAGATFAPTGNASSPLDGRAKFVAVGDFTGDGVDDVAVITEIASVPTVHLLAQCATTTQRDECPHDEDR